MFDERTVSFAYDFSGRRASLSKRGAPAVVPGGFRSFNDGSMMSNESGVFKPSAGDVTIVFRMKTLFGSWSTDWIFTDSFGASGQGYFVLCDNSGTTSPQLKVNGVTHNSALSLPLVGEVCLAVTHKNNDEVNFYIDGVLRANVASTTTVAQGTGGIAVGGQEFAGGDAEFYSVMYFNRVLTASEILFLHRVPLAPFQLADAPIGLVPVAGGALLEAAVSGSATATAAIATGITVAASAAASAVVSAALTTSIILGSAVNAPASAAAEFTTRINLDAAATSSAVAATVLTTATSFDASVSAAATAAGELTVGLNLEAAVMGNAAAGGILATQIPLSASAGVSAVTASQLTTALSFAANVGGQAASTGELSTDITLSANAAAAASLSGVLNAQKIYNVVQLTADFKRVAVKSVLFSVTRNNPVLFTRNRMKEVWF